MSVARGDVVILDFPQAPGQPPKRRPAVVVQSDHNNTLPQATALRAIGRPSPALIRRLDGALKASLALP
jgi:mRNA-degrading endonuclease toxin of MazEF toxin-antitoxin module